MEIKWTYEACYQEAKKYSRQKDFRDNCGSAYTISVKNKWLNDYTWLEKRLPSCTYEEILSAASKCKDLIEFRKKYTREYRAACKMHCQEQLGLEYRKRNKWSVEELYEIAKKYKTIKELRANNCGAYKAAWKKGCLSAYVWFNKSNVFDNEINCCYMYINEEHKIVYVGRTYRPKERHIQHKTRKNDAGAKFKKYGLELPEPIYYMDNAKFNMKYSLMIEDKLVQWFKENGWTVLNKAKTGILSGSIGGTIKKWTKKKILEAASTCKNMEEFYTKYPVAYRRAKEENIELGLDYQVKPNGYWNSKEHCKEEASKYKTVTEFAANSVMAYNVSNDNGWIEEFFPNKQKCRKKNERSVKMYSMDGTLIKEFNSPKDAADYLGKKEYSRIILCVNGKALSAFGYRWEYTIKKRPENQSA